MGRSIPGPVAGVAFDLDGVLLATERIYDSATYHALTAMGLPVARRLRARLVGLTADACRIALRASYGSEFSLSRFEDLYEAQRDRLLARRKSLLTDGVTTCLTRLRALGLPLIVATNSPTAAAKQVLTDCGVSQFFVEIVGCGPEDDPKPSPDVYNRALTAVGGVSECWVAVEDSHAGAKSARDAGLFVVGIPDAEVCIDSLMPLVDREISSIVHLPMLLEHDFRV